MKALIIDRNKFQRLVDISPSMGMRSYIIAESLNVQLTRSELMEVPLKERFKERMFTRKGNTIINGEVVLVFVEDGFYGDSG